MTDLLREARLAVQVPSTCHKQLQGVPVIEGLSSCGPVGGLPLQQALHQLPALCRHCIPGGPRKVQLCIQNSSEHFLHEPLQREYNTPVD